MPKSNGKVLITGGAGFIGSHLAEALFKAGQEIVLLDDFSWGSMTNLAELEGKSRVSVVKGDVRDVSSVLSALEGVTQVVHLAALKSVALSMNDPTLVHDVNAGGTRKVLEMSLKVPVSRFVFASSCAVYGEARYLPIDEGHPLDPISPYASSKLRGEEYCLETSKRGLSACVLRLFNVYGPRQDSGPYGGVIAKFAGKLRRGERPSIYGDGNQTRDFVSVHDAVSAILLALDRADFKHSVFNIGSGRAISINELADILAGLIGVRAQPIHEEPRQGELLRSRADIGRAKKILGFTPRIRIEDGLREYLG